MNTRFYSVGVAFVCIVALITVAVTRSEVDQERNTLTASLAARSASTLTELIGSIEPNFTSLSDAQLQSYVEQYASKQREAGLAVTDSTGKIVASSSSLASHLKGDASITINTMDADKPEQASVTYNGVPYFVYAAPIHDMHASVVGSTEIVQYAAYITTSLNQIWIDNLARLFGQLFLAGLAILLILRWLVFAPVQNLADSLRLIRLNKEAPAVSGLMRQPFLGPVIREVAQLQQSLLAARRSASEQARVSLEKIDSPWTEERLKAFTKDILKDRKIIAVSHLEPYVHTKEGGKIEYHVPASGLVTAIEPVMQATGGVWIATGSGEADRAVVDENGYVQVPPDDPKYTLKRIWLTDEQLAGFNGVCDKALYPLCHMAHVRPVFRKEDWEQYKIVNGRYAEAILAEIKHLQNPVIFIQDFQFTLVPRMIKNSRPDATIGLFWHIPWVSPETFSICPWKRELLDGMLGADLLGFHTQLHCNNFVDTVARELESLIDREHDTITRNEHVSLIKPFQASVTFTGRAEKVEGSFYEPGRAVLARHGITTKFVGLGVDRLDYIKGVGERLTAIELFFRDNPRMREQFSFIQISSPPEKHSKEKAEFAKQIEEHVNRINSTYGTRSWKPVTFLARRHSHEELRELYRVADVCMVTSLHDGMNLVAKEYVSARDDEQGALILSQFAGAANELGGAFIVNPYNAEQTAEALAQALRMSNAERAKQMRRLRAAVQNYNVYRWSAEILKVLANLP